MGSVVRLWEIQTKVSRVQSLSRLFFENFSRCAYNVFINRYLSFCVSRQTCQQGNPRKYIAKSFFDQSFSISPKFLHQLQGNQNFSSPFLLGSVNSIPYSFLFSSLTIFSPVSYACVINIATKWDLDELVFSSFSKSLISNRHHATSTSCFSSPSCCTHILLVSNIRNSWIFFFSFIKNPLPPPHESSLFDLNKQPSSSFSRDFNCFHPRPTAVIWSLPIHHITTTQIAREDNFLLKSNWFHSHWLCRQSTLVCHPEWILGFNYTQSDTDCCGSLRVFLTLCLDKALLSR